MVDKIDPEKEVAGDERFKDQICPKCGALIIMDMETGEPMCNCNAMAEAAAKVAAAREAQKRVAVSKPAPVSQPAPPVDQFQGDPAEVAPQAEEQVGPPDLKVALKAIPGSPSADQIEAWKQNFGSVYAFGFGTNEIYVWRPMNRREWQKLISNEALAQDEAKFQEQVVARAVLWPKIGPVELNASRAGMVQTLFGVIMYGSYFFAPEFAIQMTQEL